MQDCGTFGDIQVGIILVGEVCFEGPDSGLLVGIADGHEFVRVAPAAARQADNVPELGELGPDVRKRLGVQVQK